MPTASPFLRIFVYGSLKRGCKNFVRYCSDPLAVTEAAVWGRLYLHGSGYPMLLVPPEHVLAAGTRDYLADAALQQRLADEPLAPPPEPPGDWELVPGEIFTFADPAERLPHIDELEDFRPGGPCLYDRVIVPAVHQAAEPVWTYVTPGGIVPPGSRRIKAWPVSP